MIAGKKAFTLVELIIIMTIIAFLTVMGLIALNGVMNDYGASYYNAYLTLKKVAYNVLADPYCPDTKTGGRLCPETARKFPIDAKTLCLRLTEYINTPLEEEVLADGKKENSNRCDAANAALANGDNLANSPSDVIGFTSTNKYRYYISDRLDYLVTKDDLTNSSVYTPTACSYKCEKVNMAAKDLPDGNQNCTLLTCDGKTEEQIEEEGGFITSFFVVYVDINGKEKKPNRPTKAKNETIYPDILPFIVSTKGDALPAGYPIYDYKYLSSKVKYPDYLTDEEGNTRLRTIEEAYSKSLTFDKATKKAWGNIANKNIPMSINYNSTKEMQDLLGKIVEKNDDGADKTGLNLFNESYNEYKGVTELSNDCEANTTSCRVMVDSFKGRRF